MTAEQRPARTDAELLDEQIEQVLARRRRNLTLDELEALALALRKPCPPPNDPDRRDTGRGCGRPAGQECVHMRDGGPLGKQLFHHARGVAAGVVVPPTDPDELAARAELPSASVDYEARRHYEATGDDLEGYHRGEPWSPDGAHLQRGRGGRR